MIGSTANDVQMKQPTTRTAQPMKKRKRDDDQLDDSNYTKEESKGDEKQEGKQQAKRSKATRAPLKVVYQYDQLTDELKQSLKTFLAQDSMRALTIKQPWASAIKEGIKTVENRKWKPSGANNGGKQWVLLHVSKQSAKSDVFKAVQEHWADALNHKKARLGHLIAVMHIGRVSEVAELEPSFWATGPFCWEMDAVIPLLEPCETPGQLGLWKFKRSIATLRVCLD